MIRFSVVYGIVFIIYGWDHLETLTFLTFMVIVMTGQPTPPRKDLINNLFPLNKALLSPYSWGGMLGGVG